MPGLCLQNPKLLRVKEVQIRKNREHTKTTEELKRVTVSHKEKSKELQDCTNQKTEVEKRLEKAEAESQTGVTQFRCGVPNCEPERVLLKPMWQACFASLLSV